MVSELIHFVKKPNRKKPEKKKAGEPSQETQNGGDTQPEARPSVTVKEVEEVVEEAVVEKEEVGAVVSGKKRNEKPHSLKTPKFKYDDKFWR